MELLLALLVLGIVAYAVYVILNFIPLPEPIKTLVWIVFGAIVLVKVFALLGTNLQI